jgi:hypothetical protein
VWEITPDEHIVTQVRHGRGEQAGGRGRRWLTSEKLPTVISAPRPSATVASEKPRSSNGTSVPTVCSSLALSRRTTWDLRSCTGGDGASDVLDESGDATRR